jgi:hypothetical protein
LKNNGIRLNNFATKNIFPERSAKDPPFSSKYPILICLFAPSQLTPSTFTAPLESEEKRFTGVLSVGSTLAEIVGRQTHPQGRTVVASVKLTVC